jgi:hypothetical protein
MKFGKYQRISSALFDDHKHDPCSHDNFCNTMKMKSVIYDKLFLFQ